MDHIQFYHDASHSASGWIHKSHKHSHFMQDEEQQHTDKISTSQSAQVSNLTEEGVEIAKEISLPHRKINHGMLAMVIAYNVGIFREAVSKANGEMAKQVDPRDFAQYKKWEEQILTHVKEDVFK